MVTFSVDDVTQAGAPLPTRPLGGLFADALAVGGDPVLPVLDPDGVHPLLSAVARAFAEHRPLVLSPDAVWLTIASGVAQHIRLHAVAGWYLAPATLELNHVLDRIVAEYGITPAEPVRGEAPAEVVALYHRVGSATLFDGRWKLVPMDQRRYVSCGTVDLWAETLFELADGRSIVEATDLSTFTTYWLLCRLVTADTDGLADPWMRLADDPADVAVLDCSLAMLLNAALDSGGDVAHLETCRLNQLAPRPADAAP